MGKTVEFNASGVRVCHARTNIETMFIVIGFSFRLLSVPRVSLTHFHAIEYADLFSLEFNRLAADPRYDGRGLVLCNIFQTDNTKPISQADSHQSIDFFRVNDGPSKKNAVKIKAAMIIQ